MLCLCGDFVQPQYARGIQGRRASRASLPGFREHLPPTLQDLGFHGVCANRTVHPSFLLPHRCRVRNRIHRPPPRSHLLTSIHLQRMRQFHRAEATLRLRRTGSGSGDTARRFRIPPPISSRAFTFRNAPLFLSRCSVINSLESPCLATRQWSLATDSAARPVTAPAETGQ